MGKTAGKGTYSFALLLLLASGAASLGHESLWTRRLADMLGANVESSMRVLGCFFFGLSLGAATIARVLPRIARPWKILGLFEFGIGIFSIPAVMIPQWTEGIWPLLGPDVLLS